MRLLLLLVIPLLVWAAGEDVQPETATGLRQPTVVSSPAGLVVSAHPLATEAGAAILHRGGTAIDAAVAVQMVLGLVEPQSSGIGGGSYLLYWDQQQRRLHTFDGRETAPQQANDSLFLDENGTPYPFMEAVLGGISIGVPGTVMLLQQTQQRFGKLPWPELLQGAIALAETGFEISPRLATLITRDQANLRKDPQAAGYFLTADDLPKAQGTRLVNTDYARTLRQLANDPGQFYRGALAQQIATVARQAPLPGKLTTADLAGYRIIEREPVCVPYRQWQVCGMGPSSSGGVTVGQIFGLLVPFDLAGLGPDNPDSWRLLGDASRLAFADRNRFLADPEAVTIPLPGLLAPAYLEQRSSLLEQTQRAIERVEPGEPAGSETLSRAAQPPQPEYGTTHFVIVDSQGNLVSMTSSIEQGFGSRRMVAGFLLNNQLTDFAFAPTRQGQPVANRPGPGKRPRSSMSPSVVFNRCNEPVMAVGSAGGSRIIGYVAQVLVAVLDWDLSLQQAISMPHALNRQGPFELEADTDAERLAGPLQQRGYTVKLQPLNSGLHGLHWHQARWHSGVDPRREGAAAATPAQTQSLPRRASECR